ncbi:hypothetical protein D9757_006691 [Collybiopsis confluens]|uniref:F-box domain-containing protein n=1 Tax=Collybiopsis confluens TaxID=2823264 RepID=A0A8H5M9L6_9AGAR|nr:hypothetical protein D9757_006691 [Collybiopsis confluens]
MSSTPSSSIDIDTRAIFDLVRSPHNISEHRILEIRQLIKAVNGEIDGYTDEISRLKSQLVLLRTRREKARNQATTLRSLFSPIHRLPSELLGGIFLHLCEDRSSSFFYRSLPPITIAAVCNRWRTLCISHSRLWRVFSVFSRPGDRHRHILDLMIERSKQQPLTLYFQHQMTSPLHIIPSKLLACCTRWEHVFIVAPSLRSLYPYLVGLQFPALESLTLATHDDEGDMDMFINSPKLHTLISTGSSIPSRRVLERISNLSYSASPSRLPEVLEICSGLSNLLTLTVKEYNPDLVSSFHHPFSLPNLTSLNVRCGNYSCGAVLRLLTAPALTTLTLGYASTLDGSEEDMHIHQFLDRSRCALTTLSISLGWTDTQVVSLLQRLPSLEKLTVIEVDPCRYDDTRVHHWHRPINVSLMRSLHSFWKLSPVLLVPKLRSLTLEVARQARYVLSRDELDEDDDNLEAELEWNSKNGESVFDPQSFVDMVLSRWNPETELGFDTHVDLDVAEKTKKVGTTHACIKSVNLILPESLLGKDASENPEFRSLVLLRKAGLCFDLSII